MEIRSVGPFLQYFGNIRERTMRLSRCVPAEKVDWSYAPEKFTIGDLLRHIAVTELYLFAENIQGGVSRYTSHGPELADNLEDIFALMERLQVESMAIFGQLTNDDLQRKCRNVGGIDIAIWKWLRAMTEHEIHHRGELYIYLGMLGVKTPPFYGLTSEEVRARSRAH